MKGVLIYGSYYGTTKEIGERISKELSIPLMDVKSVKKEDLENVDFVVLGSSVEKFKLHSGIEKILFKFKDLLKEKKLFLFISCLDRKIALKLKESISSELKDKILEYQYVGGKLVFKNLSFIDKILIWIMSKIIKKDIRNINDIKEQNIVTFIENVKNKIK